MQKVIDCPMATVVDVDEDEHSREDDCLLQDQGVTRTVVGTQAVDASCSAASDDESLPIVSGEGLKKRNDKALKTEGNRLIRKKPSCSASTPSSVFAKWGWKHYLFVSSCALMCVLLGMAVMRSSKVEDRNKMKDISAPVHNSSADKASEEELKVGSFGSADSNIGAFEDLAVVKTLMEEISAEKIGNFLKYLTAEPHIAGSEENYQLALYMQKKFLEYGFDEARLEKYNVLLTYPIKGKLNAVSIMTKPVAGKGNSSSLAKVESRFEIDEPVKRVSEKDERVAKPYNAFSPGGVVEGDVVFANYGREEDFSQLKSLGVDVNGKIALVKYGKNFRGDKSAAAASYGAVGVLIYSDPADYDKPDAAPKDYVSESEKGAAYPDGWWLPHDGIQRGSLYLYAGDSTSPGYPSKDGYHKLDLDDPVVKERLPKIPTQPVSADVGKELLSRMGGNEAPKAWQGGLADIVYRLGPGFEDGRGLGTVKLEVYTEFVVKPIYNVIGKIHGSVEPDRVVLLGNHRDAWVYGAADPNGGTAAMLEIARVIGGALKSDNFRPRRSVWFGSWDAEEFGLIGSSEWAEQERQVLKQRVVAYLNVDVIVGGQDTLGVDATPNLNSLVYEGAKTILHPNDPEKRTLYSVWKEINPDVDFGNSNPSIGTLGSGSDYTPFLQHLGISSLDCRFESKASEGLSSYPVYHSVHDTFDWTVKYNDPGFLYHKAVAQMWFYMSIRLADMPFIPMDLNTYGDNLERYMTHISDTSGEALKKEGISLAMMKKAIDDFKDKATSFHKFVEAKTNLFNTGRASVSPFLMRGLNDCMMLIDRAFVSPSGLPGRPWFKHVVFAPAKHNSYTGSSFPAIADNIFDKNWDELKIQLSLIVSLIEAATSHIDLEPFQEP